MVRHPPSWLAERQYAVDVVLGEFLGLPYTLETHADQGVEITMDDDGSGRCLLVADDLFARPETDRLKKESLPPEIPATCDLAAIGADAVLVSQTLPVVYGKPCVDSAYIRTSPTSVEMNIDIFGTAFFLLSRYEEAVHTERDRHERFPSSRSLARRAGFLDRPLVNEYAELTWWALRRLWPRLSRVPREFRVLPSHDVDWPFSRGLGVRTVLRSVAGDLVKRREAGLALRRARSFVVRGARGRKADVYNTFDVLMDASEAAGIRSAFYFIADNSGGKIDGAYSLREPWIRDLLRRVDERGHEIGLHPSYHSFRDPDQVRREAQRLREACAEAGLEQASYGGRQHFLRWENPTTWQAWEDAGLSYDSTLGYPDRPGFRCGTCYEYPVFNVHTRRRLRLRERPLIVMEQAVLEGRAFDEAVADLDELKRRCRLFGGDFAVLWHNSRLLSRAERAAYSAALR